MIDYTKIAIKNIALSKHLLSSLDELFDTHKSTTTTGAGNTFTIVYAYYKGLRFKITQSGAVIIDGSLHKAMNNGEHNYNDFSYQDLLSVIAELCQRFNLNPHGAIIQNLEVGINLNTPFNPQDFTDRCLFLLSGAGVTKPSPITKNDLYGFNKGIRFDLSEYAIKIYNKGKQYNRDENILRVEYKTLKSRAIQKAGIETLYDLCNIDKLRVLVDDYLFGRFNGLMVDEVVNETELTPRQQKHYNKRLDYNSFWNMVSCIQRGRNRGYIERIYTNCVFRTKFTSIPL